MDTHLPENPIRGNIFTLKSRSWIQSLSRGSVSSRKGTNVCKTQTSENILIFRFNLNKDSKDFKANKSQRLQE